MGSLKLLNNFFKGDKVVWAVFFMLCIVSVVEVYSASSSLGYKSGNYWWAAFYHTLLLFVGVGAMICVLHAPCKYFKLVTPIIVPFAFGLLIAVYFIGTKANDAARWLSFFGIPIQPSEIAKGAMILATAHILSSMQTDEGAAPNAMKYVLITAAFLILPIVPENLSTSMIISAVVFLMMVIGRVPARQLGYLVSTIVIGALCFIGIVLLVGKSPSDAADESKESMHMTEVVEDGQKGIVVDESGIPEARKPQKEKAPDTLFEKLTHRFGTWKGRILGFFDNEYVEPKKYDLDKNGQIGHANIAIVSSNVTGRGPGNSVERDFLSQAFSDFIYAIIIEELGIGGAAVVAFFYVVLLFRTGMIARRCKHPFPAYLAMGLALLMVSQALVNMLVAVGFFPVTGQPLPLISKGGTSSIINCVYIGVILSISRSAARRDGSITDDMDDNSIANKKRKPAFAVSAAR